MSYEQWLSLADRYGLPLVCVVVLAAVNGTAIYWIAKHIFLPLRDAFIGYLAKQAKASQSQATALHTISIAQRDLFWDVKHVCPLRAKEEGCANVRTSKRTKRPPPSKPRK